MWFEWLVCRCDMGALVAVSPLQPSSGVEQQGSDNTNISQSALDTMLLSRQKAKRRTPMPHVFPWSSLPSSTIIANKLVLSPTCTVWSSSSDNSLCKDLGYHIGPGGLKALSIPLVEDGSSEGGPWVSNQQQPLNQLDKNYQELTQSRFSHGHKKPVELEQLSPRYRELKAGFWKRLAAGTYKAEPCDFSNKKGSRASDPHVEQSGSGIRSSKSISSCKKATLLRSQGKGGLLDRALNRSMEIEVVLTGKWNASATLDEAAVSNSKVKTTNQVQQEVEACNSFGKDIQHHQKKIKLPIQDGINQFSHVERDQDHDVCQSWATSRKANDRKSLEGDIPPSHKICEGNPVQQWQRQQNGSECNFGSGGGISRGCIGEDGSPTSTSSNCQACEESKIPVRNLECNMKEDGSFWSNANWCVVDSYMTGHGKETTWTVRGFEEDNGIFEENLPDCKDGTSLKINANEKNCFRSNDLPITQFLSIEAPTIETQHGPPPKWTQQALQERVAQNLREQQKVVRSSKNGLKMVRLAQIKQTEGRLDADDGGREEGAKCQEVVLDDDLMFVGDMLYCRKGRKLLQETVLKETHDDVGGGDMQASLGMNDIESACISASWKSGQRSSNSYVNSSTYRSNKDKELLNLVSRREIRRCKRGWAKTKAKSSIRAVTCCVSMIGNTVKALRRTREDATALALKLAELQAIEVKDFKAAAFEMRTHIDLLQSEVKGLETERGFNVLMVFPWQQFLINIVIGISLVSGTLGLHRVLKFVFQLLFQGRLGLIQTTISKKEKTMVAMIILCSGSHVGKEMWQIFSHVQMKKRRNEAVFQEKLRLVFERLSHMSTLTYKNGTVHQSQAEENDPIILGPAAAVV